MYRITRINAVGGQLVVEIEDEGSLISAEKHLIAKEFFKSFSLGEGDLIDDDALDKLLRAEDLTLAVSKALDVLSYSSLSRKALIDKLRLKYKIERSLAEYAADYAVKRKFLDEASQAARIAQNAVKSKGWGKQRIISELAAKGYPRECAKDAADSIDESEYRAALNKLIVKKVKNAPESSSEYNKLIASLIRLGHSPGEIKAALRKKFSENE